MDMSVADAIEYRAAAQLDDWDLRPKNTNYPHHKAAVLKRDGYVMEIIVLEKLEKADVIILGPDGLAIKPPPKYDWRAIKAGMDTCNVCGNSGVDVYKFSFAGRCCEKCLPNMQERHEYPGWDK